MVERGMLGNKPRQKKSSFIPPPKKRKTTHAVEEIKFDFDARSEYLTGFHKRKLQRQKNAQEEAAKRERQEKIELRKQVRDDRKREVEEHVSQVKTILKQAERAGNLNSDDSDDSDDSDGGSSDEKEEWDGLEDRIAAIDNKTIDHEDEYIDEDRYTTVTVESVTVSKDGLSKPAAEDDLEEESKKRKYETAEADEKKKSHPAKKKKPKFRYESKFDRQLTRRKISAKKRGKAAERS